MLDLKGGRWGFPSTVEDDPLLEIVLPPDSGSEYPFAEERRLFYVAMTRARIGAYLVTDPVRPSDFVTELLSESGNVRRIGDLAPECPRCSAGRLTRSQSRRSLRCSNFPHCEHRAPRCPGCGEGYVLIVQRRAKCTNQACVLPQSPCPRCGMGVLRVANGRRGPFLGCSEYCPTGRAGTQGTSRMISRTTYFTSLAALAALAAVKGGEKSGYGGGVIVYHSEHGWSA